MNYLIFIGSTVDPEKAFSNWMARDIGFANQLASQTEQFNLRTFLVDGTVSIEDTFSLVEKHFQLKRELSLTQHYRLMHLLSANIPTINQSIVPGRNKSHIHKGINFDTFALFLGGCLPMT
ncbi:hypothetical protein [Paenibacillus sp. V4I5]|uniref:hypothetical protein n=1 Tax=Paenibacillus sp. V4I5 TaxID=3042306 RepID=UPI002794FE26|nr:hypothetical protein [Paenibacillus sp. V4I5]MDQ0920588.1 hypothetical protein [Paenibacillus sp. V4I5]